MRKASDVCLRFPLPPPPLPARQDSDDLVDIEAPPTPNAGPLNERAWIAANVRIPAEPYRGPDSPYALPIENNSHRVLYYLLVAL